MQIYFKKGGNDIKGIKGKVTMSLDGNMGKVIDPGDALGTCVKVKCSYGVPKFKPSHQKSFAFARVLVLFFFSMFECG